MSVTGSDPFAAAPLVEPTFRRLGERTCVINVGSELRHMELLAVDEAVHGLLEDGCSDLVFDLSYLRRYEPYALVRLARDWDRLAQTGCTIHVAARHEGIIDDLGRLVGTTDWQLHRSTTRALRSLLSTPV